MTLAVEWVKFVLEGFSVASALHEVCNKEDRFGPLINYLIL